MQKAFEKIVERLEEEKSDWNDDYNVPINKAIEIVNQVAEEYKGVTTCYLGSPCEYQNEDVRIPDEEVCEWAEKSVGSIKLVREPHKLRLFHIEEERQYCPYCGKKIKVIGG